jgi:hypothetical protein
MRSILSVLHEADHCRRVANRTEHQGQKQFYRHLERRLLDIATVKQWLHDTEATFAVAPSISPTSKP